MTKNELQLLRNILFSSYPIQKNIVTLQPPYAKCGAKSLQTIQRLIINLIPPLKNNYENKNPFHLHGIVRHDDWFRKLRTYHIRKEKCAD